MGGSAVGEDEEFLLLKTCSDLPMWDPRPSTNGNVLLEERAAATALSANRLLSRAHYMVHLGQSAANHRWGVC